MVRCPTASAVTVSDLRSDRQFTMPDVRLRTNVILWPSGSPSAYQVSEYLVERMKHISESWLHADAQRRRYHDESGDHYQHTQTPPVVLNYAQLGQSLVKGTLASSYQDVRSNIFQGVCIAQHVLQQSAPFCAPDLFRSVTSALVAYGVSFRSSTAPTAAARKDYSASSGVLRPPTARIFDACWCLHHVAVALSKSLHVENNNISGNNNNNNSNNNNNDSILDVYVRTSYCTLANLKSVIDTLQFYAVESASSCGSDAAAGGVYSVQDLNSLFAPGSTSCSAVSLLEPVMADFWLCVYQQVEESYGWSQLPVDAIKYREAMQHLFPPKHWATIMMAKNLCNASVVLRTNLLQRQMVNSAFFRIESLLLNPALSDACDGPTHQGDASPHGGLYDVDRHWRRSLQLLSASLAPSMFSSVGHQKRIRRQLRSAYKGIGVGGSYFNKAPTARKGSPTWPRLESRFGSNNHFHHRQDPNNRAAVSSNTNNNNTNNNGNNGNNFNRHRAGGAANYSGSSIGSPLPFVGLRNVGNTCFLNSVVQLFFCAVDLQRGLMEWFPAEIRRLERESGDDGSVAIPTESCAALTQYALVLLFSEMHWRLANEYSTIPINPTFFVSVLPHEFKDMRQHDASEFSKLLLEHLDSEERRGHRDRTGQPMTDSTLVERCFGGYIRTEMKCLECGTLRSQDANYWDCSVPVKLHNHQQVVDESFTATSTGARASTPAAPTTTPVSDCQLLPEPPSTSIQDGDSYEAANVQVHKAADGRQALTIYNNGSLAAGEGAADDGSEAIVREPPAALPQQPISDNCEDGVSLQHLLDTVTDPSLNREVMEGENRLDCEHCGSRTATSMCARLVAKEESDDGTMRGVPSYFTVQLNRFQYSRTTGQYEKLMDAVKIQEVISLPISIESHAPERAAIHPAGDGGRQSSTSSPPSTTTAPPPPSSVLRASRQCYRIRALIIHSGSTPNSGHYFVLAKRGGGTAEEREQIRAYVSETTTSTTTSSMPTTAAVTSSFYTGWFMINDSAVQTVSETVMTSVLAGRTGVYSALETPYVLLYERIVLASGSESGPISDEPSSSSSVDAALGQLPDTITEQFRMRAAGSGSTPWVSPGTLARTPQQSSMRNGGHGGWFRGRGRRRGGPPPYQRANYYNNGNGGFNPSGPGAAGDGRTPPRKKKRSDTSSNDEEEQSETEK